MKRVHNLKVSISGVRGVVGDSLTPGLITDFAAAFGEYVGGGRVVVGRDTRPTGPMFEHAVVAGLLAVGCQPVLTGIVPTPTVQIVVDEYNANGGIMLSASHNPVEWNALKFIGSSGILLDQIEATELLDVYNQPDRQYAAEDDYRHVRRVDNAFDLHRHRLARQIQGDVIRRARFRVAVDCCNGVGALYTRRFLEELGAEVFTVFDETDGVFRRPPEPVPDNLGALGQLVRDHRCVIGFAQDPDADRIVIVDSRGAPIGEQYSVVLAAEHVLSRTPGAVVVNIQTTKAIHDVARRYGCAVHHAPVGEINVTTRMRELGAVIGGEGGSGGVIWPAVHPCRDSYTGMALVLEMMAVRGQSLEEILASIPRYACATAQVRCSGARALEVIRDLTAKHSDANPTTLDGLRLDWDEAWVLIRPSNTEPIIRVSAEAQTPAKASALVKRFVDEIRAN